MGNILLRTENLSIQFGALKAVNDVSLSIEADKFTAILGPNGAGKTTFFNLISGLYKPSSGKVFFKDKEITKLTPQQRIHAGMGRSFQLTNVFPALSAHENVRLSVQSAAKVRFNKLVKSYRKYTDIYEETDRILQRILLFDKAYTRAGDLSHGEQRKLELGMVLAQKPEVLLLDEPTAGMSIEEVPVMIDLLRSIKDAGDTTIVLIEHKMNMVKALSDVIVVLVNGEVLCQGDPEAVSNDPAVMAAYLGGGVVSVAT
ncbi:MAG: ABC transporter ATP-binding protein [Defluviitaleaceae bacterium]|nr:ABC transporter ATP-binding protein [Defluviitaleaceae bacterium]MCL2239592.1 ABC transporter ATP-binding protein [Defluviitaleaceae bacterium]